MSKPMVVTLPCVLWLLDFWPLKRIARVQPDGAESGGVSCRPASLGRLVGEKVPFFLLVAAGSIATLLAQAAGGAVAKLEWGERLANAALAYTRYTARIFWPTDLAIVYPHPRHWPLGLALAAFVLLAVWTLAAAYNWRKAPYLTMGWLWFVGTLVPTIGLIQVGAQSMADRYTYVPSIGLFIAIAWGAAAIFPRRGKGKFLLPVLGGAALILCIGTTTAQIRLWGDSITLFRHTVEVTTDNYAAENVLGKAYEGAGRPDYALACYEQSVASEPRFPQSQFNLGMSLLAANRTAEGLAHLERAAELTRHDAGVQYDLGLCFAQHASWTNAVVCFSNAISGRPDFAPAHLAAGGALANLGRAAEAAPHLREALRLDSALLEARTNLDRLLAEHPELR